MRERMWYTVSILFILFPYSHSFWPCCHDYQWWWPHWGMCTCILLHTCICTSLLCWGCDDLTLIVFCSLLSTNSNEQNYRTCTLLGISTIMFEWILYSNFVVRPIQDDSNWPFEGKKKRKEAKADSGPPANGSRIEVCIFHSSLSLSLSLFHSR